MSGFVIVRVGGKTIVEYPQNVAVIFLLPPYIPFSPTRVESHVDEEGNIVIDITPEETEEK